MRKGQETQEFRTFQPENSRIFQSGKLACPSPWCSVNGRSSSFSHLVQTSCSTVKTAGLGEERGLRLARGVCPGCGPCRWTAPGLIRNHTCQASQGHVQLRTPRTQHLEQSLSPSQPVSQTPPTLIRYSHQERFSLLSAWSWP